MKNQKLINSICDMLVIMNKPLNQKLAIWGKLDTANTKELKQIESDLNTEILSDIGKACRKIQGLK